MRLAQASRSLSLERVPDVAESPPRVQPAGIPPLRVRVPTGPSLAPDAVLPRRTAPALSIADLPSLPSDDEIRPEDLEPSPAPPSGPPPPLVMPTRSSFMSWAADAETEEAPRPSAAAPAAAGIATGGLLARARRGGNVPPADTPTASTPQRAVWESKTSTPAPAPPKRGASPIAVVATPDDPPEDPDGGRIGGMHPLVASMMRNKKGPVVFDPNAAQQPVTALEVTLAARARRQQGVLLLATFTLGLCLLALLRPQWPMIKAYMEEKASVVGAEPASVAAPAAEGVELPTPANPAEAAPAVPPPTPAPAEVKAPVTPPTEVKVGPKAADDETEQAVRDALLQKGLLVVRSNQKAVVRINGKNYGSTPLTGISLKPGEYTVTAIVSGRASQTQRVRVDADAARELLFEF